jgi:hypothetical protein
MAAEAYARDGDWSAQARINSLRCEPDADARRLFDRYQANGPNPTARALARLADRLNVRTPAMQVYLAEVVTPTPETVPTIEVSASPGPIVIATPTVTPEPLPTPTPTPIPDYQVIDRAAECTTGNQPPQIRVIAGCCRAKHCRQGGVDHLGGRD